MNTSRTQNAVPPETSYCLIQLTKGLKAAVDLDKRDFINQWRWHVSSNCRYAVREVDGKDVYLHHVLLPPPAGKFVDHWNGDSLDNRMCNLRIVTKAENTRNCAKRRDNSSGITGVQYNGGRWYAGIRIDGYWRHVGCCRYREDAIQARWNAELIFYGEHAFSARPALIDRTGIPEPRAAHRKTAASNSGFTNISWHKRNQKWGVLPRYKGKTINVGWFSTLEKAQEALAQFWVDLNI